MAGLACALYNSDIFVDEIKKRNSNAVALPRLLCPHVITTGRLFKSVAVLARRSFRKLVSGHKHNEKHYVSWTILKKLQ